MSKIPDTVIQEIIKRVSIVDLVSKYVQLTPKGDRFWGLSPFKTEKTPSFSVNPERNAYYCFSTQQGGNSISFVMEVEHLSFPEAVRFLAKSYGISLQEEEGESPLDKSKKALEELYQRLTGSLNHLLTASDQGKLALNYALGRGFSLENIQAFKLGYSPRDPHWLHNFLTTKGYTENLLAQSGLFSKKNPSWCIFNHRLMFPIQSPLRQTIGFGGRLLEGDGPKYINSPETLLYKKGSTLFALDLAKDAIKQKNEVIICEGYLDVMALHQAGISNAVAPLGTAFTEDQGAVLKRLCSKVVLLFDGDAAGIKATIKTLMLAEKLEFETSIIEVPDAKDPAEILQRDGSQNLGKIVELKMHAFEYLVRTSVKGSSLRTPEGKDQLIKTFVPYLQSVKSEVRKEACVSMLSDVLSMDAALIKREFARRDQITQGIKPLSLAEPIQRQSVPVRESNAKKLPVGSLEFRLMVAVFLNMEYFQSFRNQISIEDLREESSVELYLALEESFRQDSKTFEEVITRVTSKELIDWLRRKYVENEYVLEAQQFIKDGIRRLKCSQMEHRRLFIEQELARLSHMTHDDSKLERELLEEKMVIDKTLRDLRSND